MHNLANQLHYVLLFALFIVISTASAQAERLCIGVKDPKGLAVAGATVHVEPLTAAAIRRGETGQDGRWCQDLPPGLYVVRGFGTGLESASTSVAVKAGEGEQWLSLVLQLSAVASQVEVTSSRLPESLLEAPLPVAQIHSTTFTKIGARQLNDALQEQPELVTFAGGSHSGGGSTNLQGFSSRDVEILVDGQPLTGRVSGYVDLNTFDASILEAVEIKTGASAMTYGQQGMGGAINLITKRATNGSHAAIETGYGSFNTGLIRADGGIAKGDFSLYAASAVQRSLGYDLDDEVAGKTQSANRVRNLFSSMYLPRWREWSTGLTFFLIDQNFWGYDGSEITGIYDFRRPKKRLAFMPRVSRAIGSNSLVSFRGRHLAYRSDEDLLYRDPLDARLQLTTNEANGADAEWTYARPGGFQASSGIFFNRLAMIGDRLNTNGNFATTDVWSQVGNVGIPLMNTLRLVAGYRADHDTNFGSQFSPQLALAWRAIPRLSLSASVTRGMRAPDFNELYILHTHGGGRVRIYGNPSLRPQKSWSYSASALLQLGERARIETRLFHHDMEDLIQTSLAGREGGAVVYRYGNVGQARIRGISATTTFTPHRRLELIGGYQYLDTLNRDLSTVLEYAPRHRANVRISYSDPWRGILLSVFGNASSPSYFGLSGTERQFMESFELFGINIQKDLTPRMALRCTFRNLSDNVDPSFRLTAPFSVEASLRFQIKRAEGSTRK
ncbi:MAG: TonB-dependent receptor [Bryobacterales bacterium]|nr:TonB-dependent receptor [Bryobacterales bacterium]